MRFIFSIMLGAFLLTLPASLLASPFDGAWKHDFGCAGTQGVWVGRCAAEHPFFELDIWSKGNRLCGTYEVDVIDHDDSEDEVPMTGQFHGNVAKLTFRSSFGPTGMAQIRLFHGKLQWKILESHPAQNWMGPGEGDGDYLPEKDVLTKLSAPGEIDWMCKKQIGP